MSLVEVALALAVSGIVLASALAGFDVALRALEQDRDPAEQSRTVRALVNRLDEDLRYATRIERSATNELLVVTRYLLDDDDGEEEVMYRQTGSELRRLDLDSGRNWVLSAECERFLPGGLQFWSTLQDGGSVNNPVVGCPGGYASGVVDYVGSVFGSGADCSRGHLVFPGQFPVSQDEGTFECWFRPGPDLAWSESRCLFEVGDGTWHVALLHGFTVASFPMPTWHDTVTAAINKNVPPGFEWAPTWAEGQWVHVALVWDHDGLFIAPGANLALYVDGELVAAAPYAWTARSMPARVQVGGSTDLPTSRLAGVIDNPKLYDRVKTQFDGRYREDDPGLVTWEVALRGAETWQGRGVVTPR